MAKIKFNEFSSKSDLLNYIYSIISPHAKYLKIDDWKGLPEIMNKDNSNCPGSCNTQAWSIATLIESLFELGKI
jgi:glycogen debranching enzyme